MNELPNDKTSFEFVPEPGSGLPVTKNDGVPKTESEIEDDEETIAVANNPKFLAILERSRARHKVEGGISLEEMRRRLGLDG
jgi:hypothetical protein